MIKTKRIFILLFFMLFFLLINSNNVKASNIKNINVGQKIKFDKKEIIKSNSKKIKIKHNQVEGLKCGKSKLIITNQKNNTQREIILNIKNNYKKEDLKYMACIIYSEAGNQSFAGKKAVGIVVYNRIKSKAFPNTLKGVLSQHGQFSPWRNGSLKRSLNLYKNHKLDKKCIKAAKQVLNGDTTIKLKGKKINMKSYHFFSGYVKGCRLKIGCHQFK